MFGSRLFRVVLTAAIAACVSLPAAAQSSEKDGGGESNSLLPVTVSAPALFKTKPSTFTVPISVADITGEGIFAYQFNILYDPTVIDPSGANFGCSTTGTLSQPANLTATCNVLPDGVLRVAVSGTNSMNGSGSILNLTFATDPGTTAGSISPLNFQSVFFFNGAGRVSVVSSNGLVTITSPTAAGVSVGGGVSTADGRRVSGARVLMTDVSGGVRTTITNPFGFFRFDDVSAGASYMIGVQAKGYVFTPRIVTVSDEIANLNIIAEP